MTWEGSGWLREWLARKNNNILYFDLDNNKRTAPYNGLSLCESCSSDSHRTLCLPNSILRKDRREKNHRGSMCLKTYFKKVGHFVCVENESNCLEVKFGKRVQNSKNQTKLARILILCVCSFHFCVFSFYSIQSIIPSYFVLLLIIFHYIII